MDDVKWIDFNEKTKCHLCTDYKFDDITNERLVCVCVCVCVCVFVCVCVCVCVCYIMIFCID